MIIHSPVPVAGSRGNPSYDETQVMTVLRLCYLNLGFLIFWVSSAFEAATGSWPDPLHQTSAGSVELFTLLGRTYTVKSLPSAGCRKQKKPEL